MLGDTSDSTRTFLSKRQRYQPIALPQQISDEALVRDWTLLDSDHREIARYRKGFRVSIGDCSRDSDSCVPPARPVQRLSGLVSAFGTRFSDHVQSNTTL